MTGIVFATRQEALPFLERFRNEPVVNHCIALYRIFSETGSRYAFVGVSGMGKVAAAVATSHLIHGFKVDWIINAGICGALTSLKENLNRNIYTVSEAIEGDLEMSGDGMSRYIPCNAATWGGLEAVRLVTCDKPVFDRERRRELARLGALADMEGAAVSRVAQIYDLPCTLVKGVTDFADENGREAIKNNIQKVSMDVANILENSPLFD